MGKYIDRDSFMHKIQGMTYKDILGREAQVFDVDNIAFGILRELRDFPAANVAPVIPASWKYYHKQNRAVCTNCSFERSLDDDFGKAIACPNCGAKMDGGEVNG